MIGITADLSRFRAALRSVQFHTRKEEAEIVTRAARDVAFRAASFTPKSSVGKINASLPKEMLFRMAAKWLREKQGKFTKQELREAVASIKRKRKASVGALRAGWIPAIQGLGGSYRGATKKSGGSAGRGFGKKATISKLVSHIRNTIVTRSHKGKTSAEQIAVAVKGLNLAIRFVSSDRENYVRKKQIEAVLRANSDR